MIFVYNPTNFKLIQEHLITENVTEMMQSEGTLPSLLASYSPSNAPILFKNNVLPAYVFQSFMQKTATKTCSEKILKDAIVTLLRTKLTYQSKDNKGVRVNPTELAKLIRAMFNISLVKETKKCLIYNKIKGYWHDDITVIGRIIYEIVSSTLKLKWSQHLEDATLREIEKKLPLVSESQLNIRGFAFANATLDYATNQMVPHDPRFYTTMYSDVQYDLNADCPVFKNNLNVWFKGDPQAQAFVQEWFGYVLSGTFKANKFLLVYSKGGEGKSTLFGVLEKLVGKLNTTSTPLSNLNTTFGLEPLVGKKLNLATENNSQAFDTSKLKAITAGEKITVNRKNIAETEMILPIKLVYLLNELPVLNDRTNGLRRRLLILPFLNMIPTDKQDKNLSKKLDNEMSGILNWALAGLNRLEKKNYNFTISPSMQKIMRGYLSQEDVMRKFIQDKIQVCTTTKVKANEVIDCFITWATNNGYTIANTSSPKIFWNIFQSQTLDLGIFYTKYKSDGYQVIKGIKISQ